MSKKIIADSSADLNKKIEEQLNIELVPFKLRLGEKTYVDDEKLDPLEFIKDMIEYGGVAKSSCPSPQDFVEKFKGEEDSFVVTISSKLSGTFNAAKLAKKLYIDEFGEKFIHIFDSKSATIGETLVSLKLDELFRQNLSNEVIVEMIEKYIENMKTFFISESLDNLIKNGRIPKWKGKMASLFNIKPIMCAVDGEIELHKKVRGTARAYKELVKVIQEKATDMENKVLGIAHVNNLKRAESLKKKIEEVCNFKDIVIVQTKGLSSLYTDNKGIVIAF